MENKIRYFTLTLSSNLDLSLSLSLSLSLYPTHTHIMEGRLIITFYLITFGLDQMFHPSFSLP